MNTKEEIKRISKEIKTTAHEMIKSGENENNAFNKARAEANKKYGHDWRVSCEKEIKGPFKTGGPK